MCVRVCFCCVVCARARVRYEWPTCTPALPHLNISPTPTHARTHPPTARATSPPEAPAADGEQPNSGGIPGLPPMEMPKVCVCVCVCARARARVLSRECTCACARVCFVGTGSWTPCHAQSYSIRLFVFFVRALLIVRPCHVRTFDV
jgi:hypothetical protein